MSDEPMVTVIFMVLVRAMVRITVRVRFRGVADRVGKNVLLLPTPIIIHNSQKMNLIIVPYFLQKQSKGR